MQNNLTFRQATAAYAAALIAILLLDGIWLGIIAKSLYQVEMGSLMNESPRWGAAILFYIFYPVGLVLLVTAGGVPSLGAAALRGAVIGAMAYGAYNATNLAVIRGFSDKLAIVDFCWGTVLTAVAGTFASWAALRLR